MKRLMTICVVCVCVLLTASTVLADDIQPPPWRGQWSTTSQVWEFDKLTPPGAIIRPDGPAPGGQPPLSSTYLTVTPGSGMAWIDLDSSGRQGIWPLSGMMDVIVDNHNPPNEFKWVWVQITWRPQDVGEYPIIDPISQAGYQTTAPTIVGEPVDLGAGWFESTYEWRIFPNPPDERFYITGTIDVDELVIDTWCIPEPTTMLLLGLGGVMGLVSRKRRV